MAIAKREVLTKTITKTVEETIEEPVVSLQLSEDEFAVLVALVGRASGQFRDVSLYTFYRQIVESAGWDWGNEIPSVPDARRALSVFNDGVPVKGSSVIKFN